MRMECNEFTSVDPLIAEDLKVREVPAPIVPVFITTRDGLAYDPWV
jgi:hypothetical protein